MRVARFGPFELDVETAELRKNGARVQLQEQPARILAFLLEHAGEVVTREQLREKLWAADTFVDFDHGLNAAVRKLRAALDDSADTPRFIETLPRHGYRFIPSVEWIVAPAAPRSSARLYPWITVSVTVIAIAVIVFLFVRRPVRALPPIQHIAILPFATTDPAIDYLGDGLAEALIDEISKWPDLRVVSRTSAFRFKGKPIEPREVGRQLGAGAVLAGNLEHTADEYRLHVEMIDVDDGTEIWSRRYETRIADLNLLQRRVAEDMALRFGRTRSDNARRETSSPAYDLYLRGRYAWNRRSRGDLVRASQYFEQAVQLDPQFARGWAGLAAAYGAIAGNSTIPGSEGLFQKKAKAAANTALSLDPMLAEAYACRAAGESTSEWDFDAAERDFRRALELDPNYASAHEWYGVHLYRTGHLGEARQEIERAYQLEPFSVAMVSYMCHIRLYQRQYADAIAFSMRIRDIDPDLVHPGCLQWAQLQLGRYDDAIATVKSSNAQDGDELLYAYRTGGRDGFWKKKIEISERNKNPFGLACAYAVTGDRERAFAALDEAVRRRLPGAADFYMDPRFDSIRSDPRFDELARRIGLPQVRR